MALLLGSVVSFSLYLCRGNPPRDLKPAAAVLSACLPVRVDLRRGRFEVGSRFRTGWNGIAGAGGELASRGGEWNPRRGGALLAGGGARAGGWGRPAAPDLLRGAAGGCVSASRAHVCPLTLIAKHASVSRRRQLPACLRLPNVFLGIS